MAFAGMEIITLYFLTVLLYNIKKHYGCENMRFCDRLNEYIETLDCTAKELSELSGISAATVSRYRSGERLPDAESGAFSSIVNALTAIAENKKIALGAEEIRSQLLACDGLVSADKEQLRLNFNTLISVLDINISKLCRSTNYDSSTIFRFRNGSRRPADPEQFAEAVASFVAREINSPTDLAVLTELIGEETDDCSARYEKIKEWLLCGKSGDTEGGGISGFLAKLDEFDLNEYIKAIHFDEMKVPQLPFQLPTSKYYYGLHEMMESELDFLKATVFSKSKDDVTLYSDMPMTEMAKDPDFPKKWMYGMALMLKKGLHLNNIHNIDRSFEEMMLGLESWIPMYMTGQISPYYLKKTQSGAFNHFLRVSGAAALSGEAIAGCHDRGRYYLSKTKDDIAYYKKRAEDLLKNAASLMEIYREDSARGLRAFLLADAESSGKRRNILSVPPLYTAGADFLEKLFENHKIQAEDKNKILDFARSQREIAEKILENGGITDEIPIISREEFERHPAILPLSGMFYGKDICLTYDEYSEHIRQTERFMQIHENYIAEFTKANAFRNLQILIHEGQWAMISKGNAPAIHFVIHHPKLRSAIENFIPPVVE